MGSDVVGIAGPYTKALGIIVSNGNQRIQHDRFISACQEDHTGKDEIHNIFQDGMDLVGRLD